MPTRRDFLTAALMLPFIADAKAASVSDMVLRRPEQPGEDRMLYRLSQTGPYVPQKDNKRIQIGLTMILVQYPQEVEEADLIVFSHASLTDPSAYRPLIDHLVSHGFAVAAPVHDDGMNAQGLTAREAKFQMPGSWDVQRFLNEPKAWKSRVDGCRTILDNVEAISNTIGVRISTKRTLVFGHEYGAYTAQLLLGVKPKAPDGTVVDLHDDRFYAGCLMSPQGPGTMGLDADSWKDVKRPFMVLQGSESGSFSGQTAKDAVQPYYLAPAGNKHLVWLKGVDEGIFFTSRAGLDQTSQRSFDDMKAAAACFALAYGKYDADMLTLLAGPWMKRATLGRVETAYR
jgi:predicted dienelactone hydrolase